MGKIYFQTRAYNAEKTLERCINSVLNQTRFGEKIVYYICDNGSTDKTGEIIRNYAANDSRIKAFYNKKNHVFEKNELDFYYFISSLNDDDFYCVLDSDDEYSLDFLEKMIPFIEENDFDFAVCGNDFINATSYQITGKRILPQALILDSSNKFQDYFPIYHQFMRTIWGKLFTGKIARVMPPTYDECPPEWRNLANGDDTLEVFYALRRSKRVGIYPEILHHYYMYPKSTSRRWLTRRIDSNQILYEDAENYLLSFGDISDNNREFLDMVYANSISDSLAVLCQATKVSDDDYLHKNMELSSEDKMKELRKITDYRATAETIEYNNPDSQNCKRNIYISALNFGLTLKQENEDFQAVLMLICPNCAPYVALEDIELYVRDDIMKSALYNDNLESIVKRLLKLISKSEFVKQFDLFKILFRFSENRGLVSEITDTKFIKLYSNIFFMLWQKKYVQTMDEMTDILLSQNVRNETFYQIYLYLSAMLESVDEFVFGKIKLAKYYCIQNQENKCRSVLADLTDMGIEDNDEISEIKTKLCK